MSSRTARVSDVLEGVRLSPPVILMYGVASFVGAVIALSTTGIRAGGVLVVSIGVTGAAVLALFGARRMQASRAMGGPMREYAVFLVVALVVGAMRGLLLAVWAAAWDETLEGGVEAQVINSAFAAAIWLTLAGLVFASRERYRQRYQSLLVQGATRNPGQQGSPDLDAHPSVMQVKARVAQAMAESSAAPTPADLLRVSDAIRNEIENNIRPLSHRLWFSADGGEPQVRWSRLVRDALAGFTAPVATIALIWLAGGLIGGSRLFGLERAVLSAALSTILLAGMLVIGRRMARRSPYLGLVWALVSAIVPVVAADAVLTALGYPSDIVDGSVLALLLPLALFALIVISSSISLADADREVVLDVAARRRLIPADRMLDTHQLSTYLHNSLQSELTGLAMQLEAAARSGDVTEAGEALQRVHALLARSVSEDFAGLGEDPESRAERVVSGWRGICDVEFSIDPSVVGDPRLPVAVQAAEEIIANAVRHAGATAVSVTITLVEADLQVECWANRMVMTAGDVMAGTEAQGGMGLRVLRTLSPSGVRTRQVDGGTVFEVRVE